MRGLRCLYMGAGTIKGGKKKVLYIGQSTRVESRFNAHRKMNHESIEDFFLGEITSQGVSGPRSTKSPRELDGAEHALIYYLKPELNQRRMVVPPRNCVVVNSRFFGKNNPEKPKRVPSYFPWVVAYNSFSGDWCSNLEED